MAGQFRPVIAFLGYDPSLEPKTLAKRVESKRRVLGGNLRTGGQLPGLGHGEPNPLPQRGVASIAGADRSPGAVSGPKPRRGGRGPDDPSAPPVIAMAARSPAFLAQRLSPSTWWRHLGTPRAGRVARGLFVYDAGGGDREQLRHGDAERLCGCHVDHKFEFAWQLNGEILRPGPSQDFIHIGR